MQKLGIALKLRRKEKGITLRELSEKSGISIVALSHYENCKKVPMGSTLAKIVTVLDMDYDDAYEMLLQEKIAQQD